MAAGAEKSSSLPQLNPEYMASQVFWLVVIFGGLYYVISKIALPKLVDVLEHREERISTDLRKAKELQKEAQYLEAKARQEQEAAKAEAKKLLDAARTDIAAQLSEAQQERSKQAAEAVQDAEQRIEKAQQKSLEELQSIVTDIATNAYAKVTGKSISPSAAEATVKNILAQEGAMQGPKQGLV